MFDIPSKYIVSSRLSNLDTESIRKIIQQVSVAVHETSLRNRIQNDLNTVLLAVGISNPEELKVVIDRDIPVIHIQKNCQALQASQKKYWEARFYTRKVLKLVISGLWGVFAAGTSKIRFKRGHDQVDLPVLNGNIPVPNLLLVSSISCVGLLLCLYTKKLLSNNRRDYYIMNQGEFVLIQDSVRRGPLKYTIQSVIPYTMIGLGVYYRKR